MMPKTPSAVFLPDWSAGNPYQNLLAKSIKRSGWDVDLSNYPKGNFPINALLNKRRGIDVIHLHWANEYIAPLLWSQNWLVREARIIMLYLDLAVARMRGIAIVWTIHNLIAHESKNPALELRALRIIARMATKLIIHSESALIAAERFYSLPLTRKVHVIPHGNLIGYYRESTERVDALRRELGLLEGHTVLLFFGLIRRYKGVTNLLKAFAQNKDPALRLVVAGDCLESDLALEIETQARSDPRVVIQFGRVAESDVAPLLALSDAVVLPFERTLTSSSAILAMSCGKALIMPDEARVFDIVDDTGAHYYSDESALALIMKMLDRVQLRGMGNKNKKTIESYEWDSTGFKTAQAYQSACSKVGRSIPSANSVQVNNDWQG